MQGATSTPPRRCDKTQKALFTKIPEVREADRSKEDTGQVFRAERLYSPLKEVYLLGEAVLVRRCTVRGAGKVVRPCISPLRVTLDARWSHQAGQAIRSSGAFRRDAKGADLKPVWVPNGESRKGATRLQISNITEA